MGSFFFGKVSWAVSDVETLRARGGVRVLISEEWRRKVQELKEIASMIMCAKLEVEVDKYRIVDTIGEKVLYHSVFDLFPLTYLCVDIDFRLFNK